MRNAYFPITCPPPFSLFFLVFPQFNKRATLFQFNTSNASVQQLRQFNTPVSSTKKAVSAKDPSVKHKNVTSTQKTSVQHTRQFKTKKVNTKKNVSSKYP